MLIKLSGISISGRLLSKAVSYFFRGVGHLEGHHHQDFRQLPQPGVLADGGVVQVVLRDQVEPEQRNFRLCQEQVRGNCSNLRRF